MIRKLKEFKNFVYVEIRNNYHLGKKKEGLIVCELTLTQGWYYKFQYEHENV